MRIWLVSREYSGIAEAGGVKNVACSLCESLAGLGHEMTLFIPYYGCTDLSKVEECNKENSVSAEVSVRRKMEKIFFFKGKMNGVKIVFVSHPSFSGKKAVYTYTLQDEMENPLHRQGEGHEDVNFLNVLFQKSVIKYGETFCTDSIPDVVHCQDAATAMVPAFGYFSESFRKVKYAVTIHNAGPGYHHSFESLESAMEFTELPESFLKKGLCNEAVEPFIIASCNSCITTVSPQYAEEIIDGKTDTAGLSEEFKKRKIKIIGITNGIDFSRYDADDINKSLLPFSYNPGSLELEGKYRGRSMFLKKFASKNSHEIPEGLTQYGHIDSGKNEEDYVYVAYHGRVVHQKGIEVMCAAAEKILYKGLKVKFIFAGQGAPELEDALSSLAEKFDGSVLYLKGYEKISARLSVSASDFSLHPSWFEPCGLEDFIAQTFGTVPVAHATGGLKKIIDGKTGYLYSPNDSGALASVLEKLILAIEKNGRGVLRPIIKYASDYIHEKYSWNKVAVEYEKLYSSF